MIKIHNVRKSYYSSLNSYFKKKNEKIVLDNINLNIKKHEIVGLIGKNGSGKSTLIKLVAGLTLPTAGKISLDHSCHVLTNDNLTFNEKETGIWNIQNSYNYFMLSKREKQKMINYVIDFSELENKIYNKVYTYSEGMKMRLKFCISTFFESKEILLIDEALNVGDIFFSNKSSQRIKEICKKGGTTIIASHDWNFIFEMCDKVVWLEKGKIKKFDITENIIYQYLLNLNQYENTNNIEVLSYKINNKASKTQLLSTQPVLIDIKFECKVAINNLTFIIGIISSKTGKDIFALYSLDKKFKISRAKGVINISIEIEPTNLVEDFYDFTIIFTSQEEGAFPSKIHALINPYIFRNSRLKIKNKSKINECLKDICIKKKIIQI